MNRKQLIGLLALLLALPPMAMQAQRLTGYEYWFDGKVGDRVSRSLSGYEAEIETDIATQHLCSGLHTLYMRFKQSGGEYEYSPVTSQIFFKHNAEEGGLVEYWFDDDIKNCATVNLPSEATENMIDVALDMTDAIKFPLGFHRLNIRVSTEGKSLSNIYTAHVLKVPSGNLDIIEYWVDNDFENRQTIEGKVASTDEHAYVFNDSFNLSGMPSGPHRIYYRPTNKNGTASGAVSMSSVIVGGGTPSKIEYWFDDDVAHSAAVDLPASAMNDTIDVALLMNNSEKFPLGMHQLSMRMVSKDREQSPIYSARVLKMASGKIDVIEYWVDDNYQEGKNRTVTGNVASNDENAYVFVNSFDLSDVPAGLHHVYYRATNAERNANSAVSMATVTIGGGNINKLEYWFDGNSDKRYTVTGSVNESRKECYFDKALNLSDVSEGIHRMYYRGINGSGSTRSAVSMTPIVVKSRYNVDPADVKMTQFSLAIDDEKPALYSFTHPGMEVDLDHNYDGRYLSKGNHKIKLKMSNSIGAGVSIQQDFTVKERPAEPLITLTATEKNGWVHIRSNSVPSDNGYRIYRDDINGTSKIIKNEKVGRYPTDIFFTDNPPAGTYTYYVRSLYTDIDGNSQKVKSNEVNVTVTTPLTEIGYIEGEIYYDGKRKVGFNSNIKIQAYPDEFIVQSNSEGVFRMDRIPVGKQLMVSLADNDYYTAGMESVTINKGKNHVTLHVTSKTGLPVNDNINYGNLTYYDRLTWEPGAYFKLPLTNNSHEVWNGKICIKAYPKRYDSEEEPEPTPTQGIQVLPGSVASFQALPFFETQNYQTFESEIFQLVKDECKEVLVPLEGLSNEGDTELFNFYIYCVKPNGSMSLVLPNNSFASTSNNPIEYMIDGGMGGQKLTEWKVAYYTNLIVYYCGLVKDVDKIIGKSRDVLGYAKKKLEEDYYLLTHATEENVLESEGLQEVIYDMIQKCDNYSGEVKSFRDHIKPIVKECKSITELWGYVTKTIDAINAFSEKNASMNDYEKAIYLSEKIISLVDNSNTFSPILMKYLDITKKTIENVLKQAWAYNKPYISEDMYKDKLKVKVQVKMKNDVLYTSCGSLIDYVLIKGYNNKEAKDTPAEARFENKPGNLFDNLGNAAVFVQKGTENKDKLVLNNGFPEFIQLWAEIYWHNGRVSCVPLADIGKGVSYEHAEQNNSIFTIKFESEADDANHAADIIHLKE